MTSPSKFCESCGAELRADSRFCEKCGQPVGAGGGASAPREPAALATAITCATCRNADQVVSAADYTVATDPEVKGDDDRVPPDMVKMFLDKPDKPVSVGILGWVIAPFIPTVLFFVYWFAPIHRGFKFFLFGWTIMFWASVFVPKAYEMQLYAFIGLFHLLFYWVALFIGRDQAKVQLLTVKIPEYNAAIARWRHLQYCKRCQKVWLDNTSGAPMELTDTDALLKG
jgi:hypothetical protein